jgi:hypothetical protein
MMKSRVICNVNGCLYVAEGFIEDYAVCALHDAPQTRRILEELRRPGAYWAHDRPVVLPCGQLEESDLELREAPEDAICAWEDKRLADVPTGPTACVHPNFDLTRRD